MKTSTQLLGVIAIGLISTTVIAGCSSASTPDPGTTGAGTTGVGGTGSTGGSGSTGGLTGTAILPPQSYTLLSATDAVAGPTPAPTAWTGGTSDCGLCHGMVGQGVMSLGPELRHVPATYAQWVVRNGRKYPDASQGTPMQTAMVPFPMTSADPAVLSITDADLTSVITWLDGQPKPTTGQGLYLDFCGNCHGPTGAGGLVPIKVTGLPLVEYGQKVRMGVGADPSMRYAFMPPEDATALTDAELAMITTFLGGK